MHASNAGGEGDIIVISTFKKVVLLLADRATDARVPDARRRCFGSLQRVPATRAKKAVESYLPW